MALWYQEQPLPHEHLHSGQIQHSLALSPANRTQCHGSVHPQYKDISCLFLVKFLHKTMHFQLRVFNLIFVLHTTTIPNCCRASLGWKRAKIKCAAGLYQVLAESQQGQQQTEELLESRMQLQDALMGNREQGEGRRGERKGMGEFVQVSSAVETEERWGGLH